jgi:hypothetical protein
LSEEAQQEKQPQKKIKSKGNKRVESIEEEPWRFKGPLNENSVSQETKKSDEAQFLSSAFSYIYIYI